jgi:mono/diheme cytochrome c family protein
MHFIIYLYPFIMFAGLVISLIAVSKKSPFFNFIGILIAIYGGLKSMSLVMPPLPGQVVVMFMIMSFFAFLIYFSIQDETLKAFLEPMRSVLADEDRKVLRILIVYILIPLLAGYLTYVKVRPSYEAPLSARITHPEPSSEIDLKGKTIRILGLENPLRKDLAQLSKFVEEGKEIYYKNCFFCHGDDLDGKGNFAQAFNPPPPPFKGIDTIAQLPESYVFWRIAKGWRGLPAGAHPWDSAMPSFEDFLTEEEIWKVSLFIYSASDNKPRTW